MFTIGTPGVRARILVSAPKYGTILPGLYTGHDRTGNHGVADAVRESLLDPSVTRATALDVFNEYRCGHSALQPPTG